MSKIGLRHIYYKGKDMKVTRDDIIAVIKQANVVETPETLRSDIKLTDQGVDSLGMFTVIMALQDKYEIDIPDVDVDQLDSIDALVSYLAISRA